MKFLITNFHLNPLKNRYPQTCWNPHKLLAKRKWKWTVNQIIPLMLHRIKIFKTLGIRFSPEKTYWLGLRFHLQLTSSQMSKSNCWRLFTGAKARSKLNSHRKGQNWLFAGLKSVRPCLALTKFSDSTWLKDGFE